MNRPREGAFETAIEAHLLAYGYMSAAAEGFDRERARFESTRRQRVAECQPYCQIAVWWLDQRLARMQA